MPKVYLIYAKIPSLLFDSKIINFVHDSTKYSLSNGYYIGLYGWTKNKILLDSFIEFRNGAKDIYNIITRELTKDEFKIFKNENKHEELLYYKIPTHIGYDDNYSDGFSPEDEVSKHEIKEFFDTNNDGSIQLVCTKEEFNEVYEYGNQHLFEYMAQFINAEYLIFNDKYKLALDYIGYCNAFNNIYNGIDDLTGKENEFYSLRNDQTEYNSRFGITYYGNPLHDIYENKIALFINIFYEMIVGYNPKNNIRFIVYN